MTIVASRTQGKAADDLGQPASGPDQQSCRGVSKMTEACVEADGGHLEHSQRLQNSDALLLSLESHYFTAFARTLLNGLKSQSGNTTMPIILRRFATCLLYTSPSPRDS